MYKYYLHDNNIQMQLQSIYTYIRLRNLKYNIPIFFQSNQINIKKLPIATKIYFLNFF